MNGILQGTLVPVTTGGAVPPAAIFGAANDGVGAYLKLPGQVATVTYTTPVQFNVAPGTLYLLPSETGAAVAADADQTEYGPTPGATVDW